MSQKRSKLVSTPVTDDRSTEVPLVGDDSITEVAQSPKKVFEIDLTNSPDPVVTTKLIPRTRPTPAPPLVAPEVSFEEDQSNEASIHDSTGASADDIYLEISASDSLILASTDEEDTSGLLETSHEDVDSSEIPLISDDSVDTSEAPDVSYEDEDTSEVPEVSYEYGNTSEVSEVSVSEETTYNSAQTPTRVVEIDLTNSPVLSSSTNYTSPVGSNYGCSVCFDSFRDIRKSSMKHQVTTSCGHMFCSSCIRTQLSVQPHCPVCRKRDPKIIKIYNRLD